MAAYFIAHGTVKDAAKLEEYVAAAAPLVEAAGGEFVAVGDVKAVLVGDHPFQRATIFRFPTAAAARQWFDTVEYQTRCAPLRKEAADFVFLIMEEYGPAA